MIFRNANFTKRDYEATNIVAAEGPKPPRGNAKWVEADRSVLQGLTQLWIEDGVRVFGYL